MSYNSCPAPTIGPQGCIGPVGPMGKAKGYTGYAGPLGLKGPDGNLGAIGCTGATGNKGPPGINGSSIITGHGAPISNPPQGPPVLYLDIDTNKLYYYGGISWVDYITITGNTGIQGPRGPKGNCNSDSFQSQSDIMLRSSINDNFTSSNILSDIIPTIVVGGVGLDVTISTGWNLDTTITQPSILRIKDVVKYGLSFDSATEVVLADRKMYVTPSPSNLSFVNSIKFTVPSTAYKLYFVPQWSISSGKVNIKAEGYTVQVISQ